MDACTSVDTGRRARDRGCEEFKDAGERGVGIFDDQERGFRGGGELDALRDDDGGSAGLAELRKKRIGGEGR